MHPQSLPTLEPQDPAGPRILEACGPLLSRYDLLLCDVWGVIHDGHKAYPAASEALSRFRDGGGTVVLVSNAPMPADVVARVLDGKGVPRTTWDRIVSSGDIALDWIAARKLAPVYTIGPAVRDRAFFARVGVGTDDIHQAAVVACTGLVDDKKEKPEAYWRLLEAALVRKLPFVCANPDLAVHVGRDLLPCAGAIAALYEEMGGEVVWAGKPHPSAYARALEVAAAVRGMPVSKSRTLAIGDSVRTDLGAAAAAGVDALFIASGIHRDDVLRDGVVCPDKLGRLFTPTAPPAIATAKALSW